MHIPRKNQKLIPLKKRLRTLRKSFVTISDLIVRSMIGIKDVSSMMLVTIVTNFVHLKRLPRKRDNSLMEVPILEHGAHGLKVLTTLFKNSKMDNIVGMDLLVPVL